MTGEELLRRRALRDRWRAALSSSGILIGGASSVIVTTYLRLQVHWASLTIVVLGQLFIAFVPLLFDVFDHSFNGAVIRQDLATTAEELAGKLYNQAKLPSITIWNSPEAS